MASTPLRWGIFGSGLICHDFCVALSTLSKDDHRVEHVSARDLNRAKEFANKFNVEKYSSSYEKVALDPDVDIIYVGTINTTHKHLSILAMNRGKAVLCEKPVTMNSKELEEVLECAKKNKVFFMEAVWTRCIPLYHDLQEDLKSGLLGDLNVMFATFGIEALFERGRLCKPELGGSVVMDIGIYLLTVADMMFEGYTLKDIKASGHIDASTGIDRSVSITLLFEGNKIVQLLADGDHGLDNKCIMMTSKGKVVVSRPFWCSQRYVEKLDTEKKNNIYEMPKSEMETYFINSTGLSYEAEHVRDCMKQGKLESDLVSHETSRRIMDYLENIRKQIGVKI